MPPWLRLYPCGLYNVGYMQSKYATFCKHLTYLCNIGTIFFYENLFVRSFIYSEINTLRLSKFSKISFAFNISALSL